MIILVRVVTRAKQERVERQADSSYKVWVRALPEEGKANTRVVEMLADFFNIAKSSISIVSGHSSRNKKIEIKK